jgi:hypothetical protein
MSNTKLSLSVAAALLTVVFSAPSFAFTFTKPVDKPSPILAQGGPPPPSSLFFFVF